MSTPLRKGWCPGALRPMPAKDGLLVRLRITGGILPAETARTLADFSEQCGNGILELSSRGNLQMRGVRDEELASLQEGLQSLGLLDSDAKAEAVRNVIASPLAGLHDGIDIRTLTAGLEHRLTDDETFHALPAKFSFLIDDGSAPSLADVAADVRFDWVGDEFLIGVGGTRNDAIRAGACFAEHLVDRATHIARAVLTLFGRHPSARRTRDLVSQAGADALRNACGAISGKRAPTPARIVDVPSPAYATLAAPFGQLDAGMMRGAAEAAGSTAHREMRLTPWRSILIPGAEQADVPGFITEPTDPRVRVAACVGVDGCAHGTTHTRAHAALLARALGHSITNDIALHVSGCSKGCAKASPSPFTLVARDGLYDLVRHGRAGDVPVRRGLSLNEARDVLAGVLEPA